MTTQLCFDPAAIATWLAARRAEGIALPVHIGLPGRRRAARAAGDQRPDRGRRHAPVPGQEQSVRRPAHPVRRLLPAGRAARGPRPAHRRPGDGIVDLHLYTFNAVEATERWRLRYPRPARRGSSVSPGAAIRRAELFARFAATPARIEAAARAAERAGDPPPGEWSARQVVLHLVAVETEVFQARLGDLEPRRTPTGAGSSPEPPTDQAARRSKAHARPVRSVSRRHAPPGLCAWTRPAGRARERTRPTASSTWSGSSGLPTTTTSSISRRSSDGSASSGDVVSGTR